MTTRTLFGVKLVKQDAKTTREAGALSLWLTEDGRFELRGDDLLDMTAGERGGMEWGVWDRQAGREGDWADGGCGNGVDSMNEGAKLIRDVLAEEAAQAAPVPFIRPAALAHVGTVDDEQSNVIDKINRLMRLASNCVDPTDDSLKIGSITSAKVLIEELQEALADLGRADLLRSIESKGLHIPDSAR